MRELEEVLIYWAVLTRPVKKMSVGGWCEARYEVQKVRRDEGELEKIEITVGSALGLSRIEILYELVAD